MDYNNYIKIKAHSISIQDYEGKLTELPEQIFEGIQSIDHLYIYAKNISTFPVSLNKIIVNKSIKLTNNKIKVLPEFVTHSTNLNSLEIETYRADINQGIKHLSKLKELTLHTFKGKKMPLEINNLKSLKVLHLSEKIGKKINHLELVQFLGNSQSLKEVFLKFSHTTRQK